MRGLEFEFERFRKTCLQDLPLEDLEGARDIFMMGGLIATQRFLDLMDTEMPAKRKMAMLRRLAREAQSMQREYLKPQTKGE